MRITKAPEERRHEILDTAMRLFYEKGYEKTSITDIAREIGIAQGLCYRYFPSKESLFDCAIEQYARLLADDIMQSVCGEKKSLKQMIGEMPAAVEKDNSDYYKVLHKMENKKFHDQLSLKVCEMLLPQVTLMLKKAAADGELQLDDPETAASFCVYGQLGILLNRDLSPEERGRRIRAFLIHMLEI